MDQILTKIRAYFPSTCLQIEQKLGTDKLEKHIQSHLLNLIDIESEQIRLFPLTVYKTIKDQVIQLWARYELALYTLEYQFLPIPIRVEINKDFLFLNPNLEVIPVPKISENFPLKEGIWALCSTHIGHVNQVQLTSQMALAMDFLAEDRRYTEQQLIEMLNLEKAKDCDNQKVIADLKSNGIII